MAYFNPNQNMANQLMRYKNDIDSMLNQINTPPVQNIINTIQSTEFEARILNEDEQVENVLINKRTMFLDKKNKKLMIKEVDGKISEEYEIVIPLDEKDKKILELENKLKEMEERFNEYSKPIKSNDDFKQSNANDDGNVKSSAKTSSEFISE
jgi:hypothetical protein